MMEWNKKIADLYKERAFYRLYVRREMSSKNISKKEYLKDPTLIE